jgi:hypothetical protein
VPFKPLAATEPETPLPSSGNLPDEEEYSYSDADYTHLYKKLANTYDDELIEPKGK